MRSETTFILTLLICALLAATGIAQLRAAQFKKQPLDTSAMYGYRMVIGQDSHKWETRELYKLCPLAGKPVKVNELSVSFALVSKTSDCPMAVESKGKVGVP